MLLFPEPKDFGYSLFFLLLQAVYLYIYSLLVLDQKYPVYLANIISFGYRDIAIIAGELRIAR
jgi:hypothetical protein